MQRRVSLIKLLSIEYIYYHYILQRGIKHDCFYRHLIYFQSCPKHCSNKYTTYATTIFRTLELRTIRVSSGIFIFFSLSTISSRSTRPFKVPGHGAIMVIFDGKKCTCIYDQRVKLRVPSGAMAAH